MLALLLVYLDLGLGLNMYGSGSSPGTSGTSYATSSAAYGTARAASTESTELTVEPTESPSESPEGGGYGSSAFVTFATGSVPIFASPAYGSRSIT
jgi:hypothetical protein